MVNLGKNLLMTSALATVTLMIVGGAATTSWAADRGQEVSASVLERPRPDYDAVGIRAGSFLLLPKLTTTVDFSDNIYASTSTPKSDAILLLQPEITARSDWSRNQVELFARAATSAYASANSENATEFETRLSGRYDIGQASNFNGGLGYAYLAEPRYQATARAQDGTTKISTGPERFTSQTAFIGGVQAFNLVRFVEEVRVVDYRYDESGVTYAGFGGVKSRDRQEWSETGRIELNTSTDVVGFLQGDLFQRSYRQQPPLTALNRDSNGYDVTAGVCLDLSHIIRGDFRFGYMNEDYDSAAFRSVSGLTLAGRLDYYVTRLTTVTLTADRSIGTSADPRSSGYVTSNGGIEVDHELLRNVILTGKTFYAHDDYRGIDRADDRWTARFGGTWLLNRMMGVGLFYDHIDVASKGAAGIGDYQINRLLISLVLQK